MDCALRRCNFSTVKSVQLLWICFVAGRSPTTSNFRQGFSTGGLCKGLTPLRSFLAPYKFSRRKASNSGVSGPSLLRRVHNRAVRKLELATGVPS